MGLIDIIYSIVSGGATGLIGAAISRYADYKTMQVRLENEIRLKELDAKIIQVEWETRERIVEVEAESRSDVADSEAFKTSLTNEPKIYANTSKLTRVQNSFMVALDFIRGIIRPGLTLYLCAISTAVYLEAGKIIKTQPIPIADAVAIYSQISSTILYLTSCCVLFWFGSRAKDKG